ncbi:hypothetical protein E2C01_010731 [Portunus trituberculatus]|uniref:Uncharacterized protein n=1 Tax=Portunus trituberculatus TaxID=210409 RepID=A0A5B7D9N0_PORTR|nr:hypothetical protein [Portunus trituberculatus]
MSKTKAHLLQLMKVRHKHLLLHHGGEGHICLSLLHHLAQRLSSHLKCVDTFPRHSLLCHLPHHVLDTHQNTEHLGTETLHGFGCCLGTEVGRRLCGGGRKHLKNMTGIPLVEEGEAVEMGELVCGCMAREEEAVEVTARDDWGSLLETEEKEKVMDSPSMGVMVEGSVDAEMRASSVELMEGIDDDKLIGFTSSMEAGGGMSSEDAVPVNETFGVVVVKIRGTGSEGRDDDVEEVEGKGVDLEET